MAEETVSYICPLVSACLTFFAIQSRQHSSREVRVHRCTRSKTNDRFLVTQPHVITLIPHDMQHSRLRASSVSATFVPLLPEIK